MAKGGYDQAYVREIDRRTDEMQMQLATAGFKPGLIIGSSRSGSVLGRILAGKTGSNFLGFPFTYKGIQENVDSANILFVDDTAGGNVEALAEAVRVIKPEPDADALIEAFLHSIGDYMREVQKTEPPNLSYARKWTFQREILRQMVSVKTAEKSIDAFLYWAEKNPGKEADPSDHFKEAKAEKKQDVSLDLFIQMLEGGMLNGERNLKVFKNLGVYFITWPDSAPQLPWASRSTRDAASYFIKRSDAQWRDAVADEIKKQYSQYSKMPRFFMEYPFNEQIDGINDPAAEKVDTVYEFMIVDESRTLPESFLSWCEEKGHRFYRKTNTEGSLILETTRIRAGLDYSIKNHKDFYLIEFKTSGVSPVRKFEGCARNGTCKIKNEPRDDRECLLCNNFKASFSALFGADKPGFFQWLDQKGLVTNIEYWVFMEGIKEETLSKVDMYELMKRFHEW